HAGRSIVQHAQPDTVATRGVLQRQLSRALLVHAEYGADLTVSIAQEEAAGLRDLRDESRHSVPGRHHDDRRAESEEDPDADEHIGPEAAQAPIVPLQLLD